MKTQHWKAFLQITWDHTQVPDATTLVLGTFTWISHLILICHYLVNELWTVTCLKNKSFNLISKGFLFWSRIWNQFWKKKKRNDQSDYISASIFFLADPRFHTICRLIADTFIPVSLSLRSFLSLFLLLRMKALLSLSCFSFFPHSFLPLFQSENKALNQWQLLKLLFLSPQ